MAPACTACTVVSTMVCLHVGHVPPSPGPMPPAMAFPLCTLDTTTVLDTPDSMVDTDFPSSISRPRLLMLVLRRPCLQEEGRSVRLKPTLPFSTLTATEFTEPDMFPASTPTPDILLLTDPMDTSSSLWRGLLRMLLKKLKIIV